MSQIIKTEAVVLSKLNYGDSSIIASFFTKSDGKITAMLKGGRSSKHKMGSVVDPLNLLNLIIYSKESREIQIISGADIISYYPKIKEDYEKLQYSYAVLELIKELIPVHEPHEKLFKGVVRILDLFNTSNNNSAVIFGRFFLFFLEELGYEFQIDKCRGCGSADLAGQSLAYNFDIGLLCGGCAPDYVQSFLIDAELFELLFCLKHNKRVEMTKVDTINSAIVYLEKYLKHHIPDFKGIKSLQIFK